MARGFTPDGSGYVIVFDGETAAPAAAELTEHLDPRASFLELGLIVCRDTPQLEEVAVASVLIRPPGTLQDHDLLFASMLPIIRTMHAESGLWQQATTDPEAWRVDEADASLAQWLDSLGVPTGKVPLLGSGVSHFDSRWIAHHLPRLASRVTYWTIDAGVIRRALELARRDDLVNKAGDVDAKNHRALDDARLHAAELRRYLELLRQLPADEPIEPIEPVPPIPSTPQPCQCAQIVRVGACTYGCTGIAVGDPAAGLIGGVVQGLCAVCNSQGCEAAAPAQVPAPV